LFHSGDDGFLVPFRDDSFISFVYKIVLIERS
jgi:hypothetical protein